MKIQIMDTTLRDGEQTMGVSFTKDEKLAVAKALLDELKVSALEVASARVSAGEFEAVKEICAWAKENKKLSAVEVLGFVDGGKSIKWISDAGCKVMNLLAKGSKKHCVKQLKKTPKQHVDDVNQTIKAANEKGIAVNVYLEDVTSGMRESKEYVLFMLKHLKGAKRVMLPDTLGICKPDEVYAMCKELKSKFKWDFDFHAHNDYGLAVANSLAAIEAGVNRVHTTVNSLGERTGNCSLASLVAVVHDHTKNKTSIVEDKLTAVSRLVETLSGVRLSGNAPIVGENVFTQTCGVHADGDKKGNLYHNKLLPERFGGQREYALGKTSGKASVEKNLEKLGIDLDEESIKKISKKIVQLGDKKEKITLSDLPYIVSDVLGTPVEQKVKLIDYSLSVSKSKKPQASVEIEIEGKKQKAKQYGDGQYDALMKCLKSIYKKLGKKFPKLVDYSVSIPPGGKTDALVETTITWELGKVFKTRGVDSDQTNAAIKATMNMLNQL